MYCSNCGKEVSEKAVVCLGCGVSIKRTHREGGAQAEGVLKYNWILSLVAVIGFALALILSVATLEIDIFDGELVLSTFGAVCLIIFALISVGAGVACFIISLYHKQENKFNSILTFSLSLCCLLYMITALISFS